MSYNLKTMVNDAENETDAKESTGRKKRAKREGFGAGWIIAFAIVLALGLGAFSWYQVARYGDNVIDIFADQQDAYVQLVLDQINLIEDGSPDDIIDGILGTIDSSNSEFWTLSRADSLVYVKDVAESNRYRGFSTDTYYNTDSAQQFIQDLSVNKVQHSVIEIDDRRFIISGVAFEYGGSVYRMCLLTSEHVVLDSNAYLAARVNLGVAIAICLCAMVLMALFVSLRGERWKRRAYKVEDENVELRQTIEQLNAQMYQEGLYDARNSLFDEEAAAMLVEKLIARKQVPTSFVYMVGDDRKAEQEVLSEATDVFGSRLIKFRLQDGFVLAFVGLDCPAALDALSALVTSPDIVRSLIVELNGDGASWEQIRSALLGSERIRMREDASSSSPIVVESAQHVAAAAAKTASQAAAEPHVAQHDAQPQAEEQLQMAVEPQPAPQLADEPQPAPEPQPAGQLATQPKPKAMQYDLATSVAGDGPVRYSVALPVSSAAQPSAEDLDPSPVDSEEGDVETFFVEAEIKVDVHRGSSDRVEAQPSVRVSSAREHEASRAALTDGGDSRGERGASEGQRAAGGRVIYRLGPHNKAGGE